MSPGFWVLLALDPNVLFGVRNLEEEKKSQMGWLYHHTRLALWYCLLVHVFLLVGVGGGVGRGREGEKEETFPWFWHSLSYSPHHCDSLLKTASGCVIRATTPALEFCLSVLVCWPPPPYHCFLNHNSWFPDSNEFGRLSIGQCFLEMSTLVILITSVHWQLGSVTHVFTVSEMFLIVISFIIFIIISFL